MNRPENDHYGRNNHGNDYSSYRGYSREDEHYHSAPNLTNHFEQEYRREQGYDNQNMPRRSFHEGDGGDTYERYSRERNYANQPDNRYQNSGNNAGNSNRGYQDNARSDRGTYSSSNQNHDLRGNISQGYGISSFGGTSDRFNTLNSNQNRGGAEYSQPYERHSGSNFQNAGRGNNMGNSFPGSRYGEPDASYGMRNYSDDYGSGMGSSHNVPKYEGGTGYAGGNRGGSSGNSSYGGSSSGNYGRSGSMGGRSRDSSPRNSGRGANEMGDF